ncbi:MAG TPA: response regulator [Pyrinomonadaceae bacterium]|nr:response regulator [Pyrinomonadaceae bacterium]
MAANTEARTVLVADDNDDTRRVVRWMLEQRGYAVIEAADGEQAVAVAVSQRPDLILMDLIMPVVDGFDAVRQVREHEALRGVPVIAMTARDVATSRDRAEGLGFNQYLSKPLDFLRLNVVIEKLLGGAPPKPPAKW